MIAIAYTIVKMDHGYILGQNSGRSGGDFLFDGVSVLFPTEIVAVPVALTGAGRGQSLISIK